LFRDQDLEFNWLNMLIKENRRICLHGGGSSS